MSDNAIIVENLSKRYRIGLKEETNDTFVGTMLSAMRNPLKNLFILLDRILKDRSFPEDTLFNVNLPAVAPADVRGIRVTSLARGLPVGGDLEYTDEVTLGRALEGRREIR